MRYLWLLDKCPAVALFLGAALLATSRSGTALEAQALGTISGFVVDQATGEPLAQAVVRIIGSPQGTTTGPDGRFTLAHVPPGRHSLEASLIGWAPQRSEGISLVAGDSIEVRFALVVAPLSLQEIVVTPGRFTIMKQDLVLRQTLTREDIHSIPQFGEDVYRAVTRLPGVSGNDITARFTIRGGEHEEILVLLDGVELYAPFHLKDMYGGALSVVDVMAIGGIDMMTGSFPTRYGNHLSGVFDITSIAPDSAGRTAVGISLMNARLLSEGQFGKGRGSWLFSARRGYLDLVLDMVGANDFSPVYYDVLGKVEYRVDDRHTLSVHVLQADDHLTAADDESGDRLRSSYGNRYAWLRLRSAFNRRLSCQTVASVGRVTRNRRGDDFAAVYNANGRFTGTWRLAFALREDRDFTLAGLKQDWNWEVSSRHLISAGYDFKRLDSEYDYANHEWTATSNLTGQVEGHYDTLRIDAQPAGQALGLYSAVRFRLAAPLTAEAGLRYDQFSYTGDRDLSPRLNLVYSVGEATTLRAGWGWFHQVQAIDDLDVPYGEAIFYPSQRAEHRVLGLEHGFRSGLELRVEAYQKKLSRIRPRHENLSKDVLFAPELSETQVFLAPENGDSRGIEVYLKKDTGGRFSWWASYAWARAQERLGGIAVPKNYDQRHTVYLDGSIRPNRKWRFSLAWQYRSGWPYSETLFVRREVPEGEWPFEEGFGLRNAVRFPPYHRMDLRVNRYFDLGRGRLSLFLELINLYDRENLRSIRPGYTRYVVDGQLVATDKVTEAWFPLLPSVGLNWEW